MPASNTEIRRLLAPTGVVRAAINLGNPVLAQQQADGTLTGISVTLARAVADALAVPLELKPFDGAGKVVASAAQGVWDLGFLAIDPLRAQEIAYTAPYVIIEGVFIVPQASPHTTPQTLDASGVRIAVGKGAAYELHLKRAFEKAELVQYPTSADVLPALVRDGLEAGAGIRQPATAFVESHPDYRIIDEAFMQIRQAVAVPIARRDAIIWLQEQLDALKAAGVV